MTGSRTESQGRPTDLAVLLATVPGRYSSGDGWVTADEVAHGIGKVCFDVPTTQQVAAWMRRLAKVSCPPVETRLERWRTVREYRVTSFGVTYVSNVLPGVTLATPWIPVMRGA